MTLVPLTLLLSPASAQETSREEPAPKAEPFVLAELGSSQELSEGAALREHSAALNLPVEAWDQGALLLSPKGSWGRLGDERVASLGLGLMGAQQWSRGGFVLADLSLQKGWSSGIGNPWQLAGLAFGGWQGERLGVGAGAARILWQDEWVAFPVLWVRLRPVPWLQLSGTLPVGVELDLVGERARAGVHLRSESRAFGAQQMSWAELGGQLWVRPNGDALRLGLELGRRRLRQAGDQTLPDAVFAGLEVALVF